MTFLNGILAFGALATLIPLAIHLLNRRRFETIDWAAMHLIAAVEQANQRRWRWRELLLLLIRCAIPILLALALARPVLTAWRATGGGQPSTVIILLDDSVSMRRPAVDHASLFTAAKQRVTAVLDDMTPGSEANVILLGGPFETLADRPTTAVEEIRERVDQLEPEAGTLDARGAAQLAIDQLAAARNPWRRLVILSDFADHDWNPVIDEIAARFDSNFPEPALRPDMSVVPLSPAAAADNVSVRALETVAKEPVVGQDVPWTATVVNQGEAGAARLKGHWSLDGVRRSSAQLTVPPGGIASVEWSCKLSDPGTHRIRFEVESEDSLAADNYRDSVVFVDRPTSVVLVDGDPDDKPLAGETDYLSIALSPFALARDERADTARTRVVSVRQLREIELDTVDVVVLANVRQLERESAANLISFVERGGHLAIFLGERLNVDWYNSFFAQSNESALMPIQIERRATAADPPLGIELGPAAESLESLLTTDSGRFEGVVVHRYHGLEWNDRTQTSANRDVLLLLTSGDPYFVRAHWGGGLVSICLGTADADWTNLPTQPIFLPLMQSLLSKNLPGSPRLLNVLPGAVFSDYFDEPQDDETIEAHLESVDGTAVPLTVEKLADRIHVQSAPLRRVGAYRLRYGDAQHAAEVHLPAEETDFDRLSGTELTSFAESLNGSVATDLETLERIGTERRLGREVWRWVLAAVVALMLLELILLQRARGRLFQAGTAY